MILFVMDLPRFFIDAGDVARMFFGPEPCALADAPDARSLCVVQTCGIQGQSAVHGAKLFDSGAPVLEKTVVWPYDPNADGIARARSLKRGMKTAVFRLLKEHTGMRTPWGSLTGIRPTRIGYELMDRGLSDEAIRRALIDEYDLEQNKAELVTDILSVQTGLIDRRPDRQLDVYIGIPFCPTRCLYCSFSAGDMRAQGKLLEPYLEALLSEMRALAEAAREGGWTVRAMYVGGGTPTTLSARQMERLLFAARDGFPGAYELTVEAGRPDTIAMDKLDACRDFGVGRLSVNPQSMHDETLEAIGRAHTCAQVLNAVRMVKRRGFAVNMDLIAGLPGETPEMLEQTLDAVEALEPENMTMHTLAIKRSSRLHERLENYQLLGAEDVDRMVLSARERARRMGMRPYYLYRQKYMTGNLENVGYSLPGCECLYNIDIMEETHSILALGAGGISKWVYRPENRIERAANVKNIELYIQRHREMAERKLPFLS